MTCSKPVLSEPRAEELRRKVQAVKLLLRLTGKWDALLKEYDR